MTHKHIENYISTLKLLSRLFGSKSKGGLKQKCSFTQWNFMSSFSRRWPLIPWGLASKFIMFLVPKIWFEISNRDFLSISERSSWTSVLNAHQIPHAKIYFFAYLNVVFVFYFAHSTVRVFTFRFWDHLNSRKFYYLAFVDFFQELFNFFIVKLQINFPLHEMKFELRQNKGRCVESIIFIVDGECDNVTFAHSQRMVFGKFKLDGSLVFIMTEGVSLHDKLSFFWEWLIVLFSCHSIIINSYYFQCIFDNLQNVVNRYPINFSLKIRFLKQPPSKWSFLNKVLMPI